MVMIPALWVRHRFVIRLPSELPERVPYDRREGRRVGDSRNRPTGHSDSQRVPRVPRGPPRRSMSYQLDPGGL